MQRQTRESKTGTPEAGALVDVIQTACGNLERADGGRRRCIGDESAREAVPKGGESEYIDEHEAAHHQELECAHIGRLHL